MLSVTNRWGAEAALQGYRTLMETAREIICTVDLDGRFTSLNAAFEALTGWSREEWIGRSFETLVHPDDLSVCAAVLQACLRGELLPSITHRLLARSGAWLHVESTATPHLVDGRVVGALGVVRDVSVRVQAEQELAESRRRLQALFDNALDAILLIDDGGRYVDANPAACALLGYTRDELLGMSVGDVIPPDDQGQASEALKAFEACGAYSGDYRLLCRDGSMRDAEFRSVANILPGLHMAIARDVTDRKRADDHLRQSERRLQEAEEVGHIGSWEWDLESNALAWSNELYRIFGVTRGDFLPSYESSLARVHPEDRASVDALCQTSARAQTDYAYDARIVRPNGEVRFIHARGHAVRGSDGSLRRMIGIAQDVTDRKRDGEVRRRLLNTLVSLHEDERTRISRELHDGAGQALVALLVGLRRIEDARSLEEVRSATAEQRELLAQTIGELGRLARGLRPPVLDDLGLRAALERYASDQSHLLGFEVRLSAGSLGTRRLPREVETALYRTVQEALANVARHAQARAVRISLERTGQEVRLSVVDDGIGFEVASALQSTGSLGLHGMIERAEMVGGRADIRSRLGEGTTISVVVPLPATPPKRRPGSRKTARRPLRT